MGRLSTEPARPARIKNSPAAPWLAVGAVCVGAFMGQLDASIVTLALPELHSEFHVSLSAVEWVSLSYLLALIGTVSAVGRLSDIFGRKLFYLYGFVVFSLASLGCGLAPSLAVLLVARIVQGLGAAMLQANSVALIRTTVTSGQLNRAIGLQGAAQAVGLALGPAVGGLLIATAGWRWVFLVNLPAGALGITLGWFLLPRTTSRAPRTRFDWPGVIIVLGASSTALVGLSMIGHPGLTVPVVIALIASASLVVALIRVERRTAAPLINLALFVHRKFRAGITSGLLAYLLLFGMLYVSTLYLEGAFGLSAAATGLAITSLPLCLAIAAPLGALAADRVGSTVVTVFGMTIACAAFVVGACTVGSEAGAVGALALTGFGLGFFTPANNAVVAGSGRAEEAGLVSGLLNMTRGMGTALGVAVTGAIFALVASEAGLTSTVAAMDGYRITMVALAAVATVAALVSLRGADRPAPASPAIS
jgi:EmrB/QacA subfamily drug resistance transporter